MISLGRLEGAIPAQLIQVESLEAGTGPENCLFNMPT